MFAILVRVGDFDAEDFEDFQRRFEDFHRRSDELVREHYLGKLVLAHVEGVGLVYGEVVDVRIAPFERTSKEVEEALIEAEEARRNLDQAESVSVSASEVHVEIVWSDERAWVESFEICRPGPSELLSE